MRGYVRVPQRRANIAEVVACPSCNRRVCGGLSEVLDRVNVRPRPVWFVDVQFDISAQAFTLGRLTAITQELRSLFEVGFWLEVAEELESAGTLDRIERDRIASDIDFREQFNRQLLVRELDYHSPLQIVLSFPELVVASTVTLLGSARGALKLFRMYLELKQEARVTDLHLKVLDKLETSFLAAEYDATRPEMVTQIVQAEDLLRLIASLDLRAEDNTRE